MEKNNEVLSNKAVGIMLIISLVLCIFGNPLGGLGLVVFGIWTLVKLYQKKDWLFTTLMWVEIAYFACVLSKEMDLATMVALPFWVFGIWASVRLIKSN